MNKPFTLLLVFLVCTCCGYTQAPADSVIVATCLSDTAGFRAFPDGSLLDSVRPAKGISAWEINTAVSKTRFRNFYRFPAKNLPDTVVLSECMVGFGTFCPPNGCAWYISARQGNKVKTVKDLDELSVFIGMLDNAFDACFWLLSHNLANSLILPLKTNSLNRYKRVKDGFLLRINMRVRDCPVTHAEVTYFVGDDKRIVKIISRITLISEGCI
jgi:hypothetical protein